MILPVSAKLQYAAIVNNQKSTAKNDNYAQMPNRMKLSGYNNPMKSYVSFGWCEAHYQAMYEIDEKFTQKVKDKLKEIEAIKSSAKHKQERYSLLDEASMQAATIIAQYANLMFTVAEVPPAYAVMTATKFKEAMKSSETFSNPISSLIAINNIAKMSVKNTNLNASQLERGKGATQLYSIAILLEQVEENKNKPEFQQRKGEIDTLTTMVKKSLENIYGKDIFEKIEKFGSMGKKPSADEKKAALDFLVEIDSKAKALNLPDEFEEKLKALLAEQSEAEGKTQEATLVTDKPMTIKINYPDHDHNAPHSHSHDHDHMHKHNIPHSHESEHRHMENNGQELLNPLQTE